LLEQLDRATEADPAFAVAHGLKAWIYCDSINFDPVPNDTWKETKTRLAMLARDHVATALSQDSVLGLAYVVTGRLEWYFYRLNEASEALKRGRELSPNDPRAWEWSSYLAWLQGRSDAAVAQAEQAVALYPNNPASYLALFLAFQLARDRVRADLAAKRYVELDPAGSLGYLLAARTRLALGDTSRAHELLHIAARLMPDEVGPGALIDRAYGHARIGELEEARRLVDEVRTISEHAHVVSSVLAWGLLAIGNYDEARTRLEAAIQERAAGGIYIDHFPLGFIRDNVWSDPVLDRPDFIELRGRLGFSSTS
jgi:tetratricopeptide (TPR) repeat protein